MTASQTIAKARRLGVSLEIRAGRLRYRAPHSVITKQFLQALSALKLDIVALLQGHHGHEVCAFFCGDPKVDRYCRECGGTWSDYLQHCTGQTLTGKLDSKGSHAPEGTVALEEGFSRGYTPVKDGEGSLIVAPS